ncbi:MAG: o-succinylbenzoate synthase [Lyngbya sp. HA4199-MV5]|nr:o-succinylbenzoate synthase [Lyngbya sp. HA4199-MV5]
MKEQTLDNAAPQRRSGAEGEAAFVDEGLTLRPQNLNSQAQNSNIAVQNSNIAVQNSNIAVQNLTLRPQNLIIQAQTSIVAVPHSKTLAQNSKFLPQSSITPLQNSDIAVQNSELQPQNSKLRPPHAIVAVPSSIVTAQNSILQSQVSTINPRAVSPRPSLLSPLPPLPHSVLLPAGTAALHAWKPLWQKGFRTFKWKIGVQAIVTEVELLHELTQTLPPTAKLRLDANGGLSLNEAIQWLQVCDALIDNPNHSAAIEYIEQPLDTAQFQTMQDLSRRYQTPIALDESIATLQQLQTCYANGWRGIFVIKPAIVGSPKHLRQFCQEHLIDAVFSSAFETAIGRQAGLQLAEELGNLDRAMGYGTTHWLDDADIDDVEQLWQTL